MISKRSRSIIIDVIDGNTTTSILAVKYHVTSRMIINDLNSIDYFLESHGFKKLIKSRDGKIKKYDDLNGDLLNLINSDDVVISSYLPEERILEIIYLLSMSETSINLETLSEKLSISKSTMTKDIEKLRSMCLAFNVSIVGDKRGLRLSGGEFDIRIMITSLFISYMDSYAVFDTTRILLDKDLHTTYKVFWRIFEDVDINLITDCIEIIKISLSVNLQDYLYLYVSGLISLMIKRNRLGYTCSTSNSSSLIAKRTANQMIDYLSAALGSNSLEEEFSYINHILEVSSSELHRRHHDNINEPPSIIEQLVDSVYNKFGLRRIYESELYQSMSEEIRLIKMERLLRIPTIGNIVNVRIPEYDNVYNELKKICSDLLECHLNEDHIWRLAAHVIDVCNRNQYTLKKSVIIVSDKPHQMAISLKRNLTSLFNVNVVAIVGLGQLRRYIRLVKVDYIISTINMGIIEEIDIPCVKIHPLLSDDDIKRLKQELPLNYQGKKMDTMPETVQIIDDQLLLQNLADEQVFISTVADILIRAKYVLVDPTGFIQHSYSRASKFGVVIKDTLVFSINNHHLISDSVLICGELTNAISVNNRTVQRIKLLVTQHEGLYIKVLNTLLEEENYECRS